MKITCDFDFSTGYLYMTWMLPYSNKQKKRKHLCSCDEQKALYWMHKEFSEAKDGVKRWTIEMYL